MTAAKPATVTELNEKAAEAALAAPDVSPPEGLEALRVPFPPSQVGKLPKPYRKDAAKGDCAECGKYHGLPAMHLDFVGHGYVTQRLLDVDPEWNWEPFALDAQGLPALDKWGNLWIRLTICGVTRIGVGDGATMKVLIGDALRNAAMRFGVALDLWAHGSEDEKQDDNESMPDPAPTAAEHAAAERDAFEAAKEAAKDIVRELTEGDVELTKQAWAAIGGGKWDRESLTAAYEAWVEQPKDDAGEGGDT